MNINRRQALFGMISLPGVALGMQASPKLVNYSRGFFIGGSGSSVNPIIVRQWLSTIRAAKKTLERLDGSP